MRFIDAGFKKGEMIIMASSQISWNEKTEEDHNSLFGIRLPYDSSIAYHENKLHHMSQIRECGIPVYSSSLVSVYGMSFTWELRCDEKRINWLILKTGAKLL